MKEIKCSRFCKTTVDERGMIHYWHVKNCPVANKMNSVGFAEVPVCKDCRKKILTG